MENPIHYITAETDPKPQSDKPILLNHHLCPYAERARIAAVLKKFSHLQCDVDMSKKPKWFWDLNPNTTVPTMEFPDGRNVYESDLITEMMD